MLIATAISYLHMVNDNDDAADYAKKIIFIIEQLQLITTSKHNRHYSPQLLVMSYLTQSTSASAYRGLLKQSVLCLPSESTLKRITRRVSGDNGLDKEQYLNIRINNLNELQRTVILMIDEIYVAKRVDYSGGRIQGMTADGNVASTLLCFMIKSLACKFMDVVAIYPMSKLTAEKQFECYKEVDKLLSSVSLTIAAISVDNAAVNRRFYSDFLCGGELRTHIVNPATILPTFLIIDPTHD